MNNKVEPKDTLKAITFTVSEKTSREVLRVNADHEIVILGKSIGRHERLANMLLYLLRCVR